MLDITKEDIQSLNDTDLRILIGRLCEAELYEKNRSTRAVSYGGNQDEKDGGIDVKVEVTDTGDELNGFILKENTIFQVKKPSMPASKIKDEMNNKDGLLKESIKEVFSKNGAYIIVSSADDLTDITYINRITAMKSVLNKAKTENGIVDFYDCGKIATWVRNYPALICWVNDKIQKNTNGWTSYCNWSNRREVEQEFIINEESSIFYNDFNKENKLKLIDGINKIREDLLIEQNSVRLAGLSGVGKTRLAQALFDETIGVNALNKEMVIYGDIGDKLFPDPITFIQQLNKLNQRVILIVDNCEANMHNKLTELCQREYCKISLMTIEYEVKEDDNVDSNNYYLGTTTDKVLEQLLKRDFKEISDRNIDTIVKCSDGNFRIAIYLAKSIATQQNIGILNHNELFERLFYQGNEVDKNLLTIGEVCSLFYSFDITYDIEDERNELNIISSLISVPPINVFASVEELRKRQIIQKRGKMRAVLPHALANKLAISFLERYPTNYFLNIIEKNERLCISFFRRLKFLHSSENAQKISKEYFLNLSDNEFCNADTNLLEKIKCITILNPQIVLDRIEKIEDEEFFSRNNKNFYEWGRILGYIAFDKTLFKRAIRLLIRIALTEKVDEGYNSIRHVLYTFFHLYLSFTHATLKERLEIITELLIDSDENVKELGLKLLDEILSYGNFIGASMLDCGSQIRDYGLEPKLQEWFEEGIGYCEELLNKKICYEEIKEIIGNNFRNLCSIGFYDLLEKMIEDNIKFKSWSRIWISILAIKKFDSEKVPNELMKRMDCLLEKVKPLTIPDKIQIFLNKGKRIYLNVDDINENEKEINNEIYTIGRDIALDKSKFVENIQLIDITCSIYRISWFAKGLYDNFDNKEKLIYTILDLINDENNNILKEIISSLIGFYYNEEKEQCLKLLDKIIVDERYNKNYAYYQLSYQLEDCDVLRLEKAIEMGLLKETDLHRLEWCFEKIETKKVIEFLDKLPQSKVTQNIILFTIYRLLEERKDDELLKSYIRKFISMLYFDKMNNSRDTYEGYIISELIKKVFSKDEGIDEAKEIFNKINILVEEENITFYSYEDVLTPLMELYPCEFLNIFIDYTGKPSYYKRQFFKRAYSLNENILHYIPDEIVIEWISTNNKVEEISYLVEAYKFEKNGKCVWSKLGEYIINNFFDNEIIMKNIISQIYPVSWDDKYSTALKKRENLFIALENNTNPVISEIGKKKHKEFIHRINLCIIDENKRNEDRFETFE